MVLSLAKGLVTSDITRIPWPLGLRRFCRTRQTVPVQSFGLEDTPNAVAVEVRQEVADDKGQVIEREVGGATQGADKGAFLFGGLPRQPVGRAEWSRQSVMPRLRHLRMVSVLTP